MYPLSEIYDSILVIHDQESEDVMRKWWGFDKIEMESWKCSSRGRRWSEKCK